MDDGFKLDKPTYSPREVATLYSAFVRPVSYATVLEWIQAYRNSGGKEGMRAADEPVSRRYRIPRDEVERVLLKAGAMKGREGDGSVLQ